MNVYIANCEQDPQTGCNSDLRTSERPKPDCVDNPFILVEITSPSTKDYDHGTKRELYFSLSSVRHYLLVSQTERRVGHYERSGSGWIYVDHVTDMNATILLGEIEIPIAEIYSAFCHSACAYNGGLLCLTSARLLLYSVRSY